MSSMRRLAPLALLATIAAVGCEAPTTPLPVSEETSPTSWPPSFAVVPSAPATCGPATEVGLMLGPDIRSGSVRVTNDESNLYVTYRSEGGRSILATAVFAGDSPDDIPTTRAGLPRLFRFPYKSAHEWGTEEVVWEIPLSDVTGDEAVIAAFAQVGLLSSWGEGEPITPGRDWAMYFVHPVTACAAETVGPEGGTITTPAEKVTLSIPAGALTEPVDITVEPATVDELLEHAGAPVVSGAAGPASASGTEAVVASAGEAPSGTSTVMGVTPIEGAIWNFGPDGLQFETPARVILHYDEDDLPAGVTEGDLGAYVINGIFEALPSVVDTDANTVSAWLSHFSYVFLGSGEPPDLEMTALTASPEGPHVGTPVDVVAEVRNNGRYPTAGVQVRYSATHAFLGDLDPSCDEVQFPSQGDVEVLCGIPSIDVGATATVGAIQVIPANVDLAVTVHANAFQPGGGYDANPDNNAQDLVFSVVPVGPDLKLTNLGLVPGSESTVGGLMRFLFQVTNVGDAYSPGGVVRLEATGDVVLGDNVGSCTEDPDPAPATLAIECDINPLEADEGDGFQALPLVAQSAGDVVVSAEVRMTGDADVDPTNNKQTVTIPIAETYQVDLEPFELVVDAPSPPTVGLPITAQARVFTWGPQYPNGGSMIYEALGDVVLGTVDDACLPFPSPRVAVRCDFGPLTGPSDPIGLFEVFPQADGVVTFTATTEPAPGDTDVNPDNDQVEQAVLVGQATVADLSLTNFALGPGSATEVGKPMDFVAEVLNQGPDASLGQPALHNRWRRGSRRRGRVRGGTERRPHHLVCIVGAGGGRDRRQPSPPDRSAVRGGCGRPSPYRPGFRERR